MKISNDELARFLKALAGTLRNARTGNPALSEALVALAASLGARNEFPNQGALPLHGLTHSEELSLNTERLKGLDAKAVERFLADKQKTKAELIQLGAARFSIPQSKLVKLKMVDVRETVRAALQHENSLRIISQEAQRAGTQRSS